MPTPFRAILINPRDKTITEVEHKLGDVGFAEAIGCDMICTVPVPSYQGRTHMLILDDEGLYKPDQSFFALTGYPQPLAGPAILVGVGEEGETIGATLPLALVERVIAWLDDIAFAGTISEEPVEEDTPFGRMTVLRSHATFRPKKIN